MILYTDNDNDQADKIRFKNKLMPHLFYLIVLMNLNVVFLNQNAYQISGVVFGSIIITVFFFLIIIIVYFERSLFGRSFSSRAAFV